MREGLPFQAKRKGYENGNKRKWILYPFLFLIFIIEAKSQNSFSDQLNNAIKININYTKVIGRNNAHIGNLAPVYMKVSRRNNFHEFELNTLAFDKSEVNSYTSSGYQVQRVVHTFDIGLRYQFTWSILKEGRWLPQVGMSMLGMYESIFNHPVLSGIYYDRTWRRIGGTFSLIPQLRFNISDKFFIDLGLPINIFDVGFVYQRIHDPSLKKMQQRNTSIETSFPLKAPDVFQLRLGFGLKF